MVYMILTASIVIIAVLLIGFALKTLLRSSWILGWLRGSVGITLVILAFILLLSALDFFSYRQIDNNKPVANLSFIELSPQQYKVSVIAADGIEQTFELQGDLWQLDVRLLTWSKPIAAMGMLPGYRLDRLSGRYVSLQEEMTMPRTAHSLYQRDTGVDVWAFLQKHGKSLSLIESGYGSATYLPMKDGALYAVKLTHNGLSAQPLNDRAKLAIENWQ